MISYVLCPVFKNYFLLAGGRYSQYNIILLVRLFILVKDSEHKPCVITAITQF